MIERLLKPAEVAEQLRISNNTLYKLLAERSITGYKIGAQWRFFQSDIDAYIRGCRENRHVIAMPPAPKRGRPVANTSGYYPGMKVV